MDVPQLTERLAREEQQNYKRDRPITREEVKEALKKMKRGEAVGLDSIPIEVWLMDFFNVIFNTAKMPQEWRHSVIIPLYKNKGDAQNGNNYRGIKLLSYTMKLWKRVLRVG